ncbi:hypothetical protein [Proteiniclasticum sp.]|uniref:flavodoxin family protein n=1 Tax=Proteiniclasticum sp. TaxID=2053595 RepID=UPI002899A2C7|nr:hypothetical protein [Proteiniclasticum sp.]
MKSVIVYYSQSNNTRTAAELLGEKTGAHLVELKEKKRGNVLQAVFKMSSRLSGEPWEDIKDSDKIYLMFPIWAGKSVPAVNAFLRDPITDLTGKSVVLITFQASPDLKGSDQVHDFAGNLVRKKGGIVREVYAMQGGNMNVFVGDEAIRQRMEKVRWDEL